MVVNCDGLALVASQQLVVSLPMFGNRRKCLFDIFLVWGVLESILTWLCPRSIRSVSV